MSEAWLYVIGTILSAIGGAAVYSAKFLYSIHSSVDTLVAQNKSIIIEIDEMWDDLKLLRANFTRQEMSFIEMKSTIKNQASRNREFSKELDELEKRFYDKMVRTEKILESFGRVIVKG